MSELVEKVARAVYEAKPIYRSDSFSQVSWEDLLSHTQRGASDQAKAALAAAAEWFDTNGAACAGLTPAAAIRQQLEETTHA